MSVSSSDTSAARTLMSAGGESGKITGLALSSVGTLYAMRYLTTAGTCIIEYMPQLLGPQEKSLSFLQHMNVSPTALLATGAVLVTGIVIRRVGTWLSDPQTIASLEKVLYRTGAASTR